MSNQTKLTCVSCESAFDPAPTGGFCPDCDTPHPDFEHGEAAGEDRADEAENDDVGDEEGEPAADESTAETSVASPSYCQDCGAAIVADAAWHADATVACSSCGETVAATASYCPDCGNEIETEEAGEEPAADADASDTESPDRDVPDSETEPSAPERDTPEPDASTPEPERDTPEPDTNTPEPDANTPEPNAETPEPEPSDSVPDEVTLVVNGESYTFEDGDTFGREDEAWLEDLVVAGGGADGLSYISSEHVEFAIEDDGVYVTDLSRNGTLLNATELDGGTEKVTDGDFLTLAGRAEVEIRL